MTSVVTDGKLATSPSILVEESVDTDVESEEFDSVYEEKLNLVKSANLHAPVKINEVETEEDEILA